MFWSEILPGVAIGAFIILLIWLLPRLGRGGG
jgi:hypothetical protein